MALMLTAGCWAGACARTGSEQPVPAEEPAHVEPASEAGGAAHLTLTPQAVQRLGITTQAVESRRVPANRLYGGALRVPPGRSIVVPAPLTGTLVAPAGGIPQPGRRLRSGFEVLLLMPNVAPDQDLIRLEAEALARATAARSQADRARQLLRDGAGSQREVEQAQAELEVAEAMLRGVRSQLERLNRRGDGVDAGLAIVTPIGGRLSELHVGAGQTVSQGSPLFRIEDEDPLWVRVPVYVGDLESVDRSAPAVVGSGAQTADPVLAPPAADSEAGTVDLFYVIANQDRALMPGQRV